MFNLLFVHVFLELSNRSVPATALRGMAFDRAPVTEKLQAYAQTNQELVRENGELNKRLIAYSDGVKALKQRAASLETMASILREDKRKLHDENLALRMRLQLQPNLQQQLPAQQPSGHLDFDHVAHQAQVSELQAALNQQRTDNQVCAFSIDRIATGGNQTHLTHH